MSDNVSDIKTLAKLMEIRFDNLKERLDKSDAHFDKKIEKLEGRLDDMNDKLNDKKVDIALLKQETESTTKNWGSIVGLVAGSLASIIVTVITKAMGF